MTEINFQPIRTCDENGSFFGKIEDNYWTKLANDYQYIRQNVASSGTATITAQQVFKPRQIGIDWSSWYGDYYRDFSPVVSVPADSGSRLDTASGDALDKAGEDLGVYRAHRESEVDFKLRVREAVRDDRIRGVSQYYGSYDEVQDYENYGWPGSKPYTPPEEIDEWAEDFIVAGVE